jgi:fermentation-respiration switch protein FrsA (DUF1100 family)
MRMDIEFEAGGARLLGWLYRPTSASPAPLVVMAHGWGAVKEMYLDIYAEAFAEAGFAVLVYDHRGFGASGGEPRQEIDPWVQVRDYRNAITFGQTLDGVDPSRIGVWGTSYSGGHVLVVGAVDRRVRCVVTQCPTISGWRNILRRCPGDELAALRGRFDADRAAVFKGQPPGRAPILPDLVLTGGDKDAFPPVGNRGLDWFGGMRADRLASWHNELTLRSLEMYTEYDPGSYVSRIAPTPLLVIAGSQDTLTPTDEILAAFNDAREPKKLLILDGGHYDLYGIGRAAGIDAAADWFRCHLG